jgi:hypothetical protein
MSSPWQAASPGSNVLALVCFTAGLVSPLAFAIGWLITYSPPALQALQANQADTGPILILDGVLAVVGVLAALSALVVGIIALVLALVGDGRSPRGKSHIGFAVAGVVLGALDGVGIILLLAVGFALFASLAG